MIAITVRVFARSGGHHKKGLAQFVLLESLARSSNGSGLVITFDDRSVAFGGSQWLATLSPLDDQLKLCLFVEALDRPGRIVHAIPDPVFVAI